METGDKIMESTANENITPELTRRYLEEVSRNQGDMPETFFHPDIGVFNKDNPEHVAWLERYEP